MALTATHTGCPGARFSWVAAAAERTSLAAGDTLLAARVRYCQARQFQHLHHHRDALETVRLARQHVGDGATPTVTAMLLGAEAASLAALGRQQEAIRVLGQTREAFDRRTRDHEPEWMRFYDQGELLVQYGRVYRDIARRDEVDGQLPGIARRILVIQCRRHSTRTLEHQCDSSALCGSF